MTAERASCMWAGTFAGLFCLFIYLTAATSIGDCIVCFELWLSIYSVWFRGRMVGPAFEC